MEAEILQLEEELRQAMLASDVVALDRLIADDLLFTNHMGLPMDKTADLQAHASGILSLTRLEPSEQQLRLLEDAAVVSVRMEIEGTYDGQPANGSFRFTRVWVRRDGRWQIQAAHAGLVG